jgi:tetratricopeptide (TPR) repeat protein
MTANRSVVEAASQPNPEQLEDQASAARRRGEYARAASLYRAASALRRQSDPARAAWDMAHAVECLAAGGQVDEAVAARKELLRTFPDQAGPKAAANSALRSVRLPPDDEAPAPVK